MTTKQGERIELLDTTLRDGAQAEGISFSVRDKLAVVEALDELGIPLIEAGNPGSNPKDLEFFQKVRELKLGSALICSFGATRRPNVPVEEDPQVRSLLSAGTPVAVIFGKTWALHVTEVLKTTLDENLAMIRDTVAHARTKVARVVYDAEHFFDGWKADPDYALKTLAAAAGAGADTICLCDTNGGAFPEEVAAGVRAAFGVLKPFPGVLVGMHAHNDAGMAVANSWAAVQAGARHVQGTLAGFGERCGNANLATILANLQLKKGYACIPADRMALLTPLVRRVAEVANIVLSDDMPYVGRKAFAHKAGMHMDGVRKCSASFEHVPPDSVGSVRRFLMSEVAGRSAVLERLRKLDPSVQKGDPVLDNLVATLKELEQKGYQFEGADGSFDLLMRKALGTYQPLFELVNFRVLSERPAAPETGASVLMKVRVKGETEITAAEGDGPVNALDQSLRKALERFYPALGNVRLTDYKVRVLNGNAATEATVRVLIESTDGREVWTTVGVSADIIEASWFALRDSIEYKLIRDLENGSR